MLRLGEKIFAGLGGLRFFEGVKRRTVDSCKKFRDIGDFTCNPLNLGGGMVITFPYPDAR